MTWFNELLTLLENRELEDEFPFLMEDDTTDETSLLEADPPEKDKGETVTKADAPATDEKTVGGEDTGGIDLGGEDTGGGLDLGNIGGGNNKEGPKDVDNLELTQQFKSYIAITEIYKTIRVYITLLELLMRRHYSKKLARFKKDIIKFEDTINVLVTNWPYIKNKRVILARIKKISLYLDKTFLRILDSLEQFGLKNKIEAKIKEKNKAFKGF